MSPERKQDACGYYYTQIPYNHDTEVKGKEVRVAQTVKEVKVAVRAAAYATAGK